MKKIHFKVFPAFAALLFFCLKGADGTWYSEKRKGYSLFYTSADKFNKKEYTEFFENGIKNAKAFFHSSFKKDFSVYIHPNRYSLDSTWQKDWKMPEFKSECWMVASGVAKRLDIISPKSWETQACEHNYSDKIRTQQIITHELVHVYHGQMNFSPDFNDSNGIEWFVEGLATYASGQCNKERISEIKKAISENTVPNSLDQFWTGRIRYGLSGSVVMYIDSKYGRNKLIQLLPLNKNAQIFSILGITEQEFLTAWRNYIQNL